MGNGVGANPTAAFSPILCMLVLLLLGFLKVAFTTLAATSKEVDVEKEGTPMITKLNISDSFAAAFFDTVHAVGVSAATVVLVP